MSSGIVCLLVNLLAVGGARGGWRHATAKPVAVALMALRPGRAAAEPAEHHPAVPCEIGERDGRAALDPVPTAEDEAVVSRERVADAVLVHRRERAQRHVELDDHALARGQPYLKVKNGRENVKSAPHRPYFKRTQDKAAPYGCVCPRRSSSIRSQTVEIAPESAVPAGTPPAA